MLLEFRQLGLYGFKVWQVLGAGRLLCVLDHAVLVDNERGPGGGITDPSKAREENSVGLGRFLVQVTGQSDGDLLLLSPGFLSEWAVHAEADDAGAQVGVSFDAARNVAQFLSANASEGQREEQQHGVRLAEVVREFHVHQAISIFRLEGEIRSFGTYCDHEVCEFGLYSLEEGGCPPEEWTSPAPAAGQLEARLCSRRISATNRQSVGKTLALPLGQP